jgi:tetratricopeptide (TPR) repeat protein
MLLIPFVTVSAFVASSTAQALPERTLKAARSLLDAGKLEEAEQLVRSHLTADPRSADAHFLLGYILFREIQAEGREAGGAHSEKTRAGAKASLAEYAEGSRYQGLDAFDLKIAALDQTLVGDLISADKLLTRSVAANPRDPEAWYYLGRTKYNENRFEEAVHAFQQCLALQPRNVKAQDNLGLSYAGLGRSEDAIAAYQAAISWQTQSSDRNPGPYLNLGTLFVEQNRPQEGIQYLLRATEISPSEPRSHEQLGKAYLQLDDATRARSALETAVRLEPGSGRLHYMLGQVYRRAGLIDDARAEFARAAALNASRSVR